MSEIIVKFHENEQIADELLKFAVIMARHENKWIFCRHKERNTYEIPGGHKEIEENIDHTAERELSEETGAVQFTIKPVCFYSVTIKDETTYGKLYFAEIYELGSLSHESEIAEIYYFDGMPDKLTYPAIQPFLYEKVQMWLNLQSAKDEMWDVYDAERNLTGRTHRRADPLAAGDYHLVAHILLEITETVDIEELIALMSKEYICLRKEGNSLSEHDRVMFLKGYIDTGFADKVFHIHVRNPRDSQNHAAIWDELYFRDFLIAHPETTAEYTALKYRLFKDYEHNRNGYTAAKCEFIKEITKKAWEINK